MEQNGAPNGSGGNSGNGNDTNIVNIGQMRQYLDGVNYPARKQDLLDYARSQEADEDVITTLEELPDQEYNSITELSDVVGQRD